MLTGKRCLQSNERRIALANIEESRQPYYDALQTYDEQEDLMPLVQFFGSPDGQNVVTQHGRQEPRTTKTEFIFAVMRVRRDFG